MIKSYLSAVILLSAAVVAKAQLAGVDSNSGTGNWEYRAINPSSGATTLLNTFSLADGVTDNSFVTDPSSDLAYLMSGNGLYEFNLVTGAVLGSSTLDTDITDYRLSSSGLVGISFNSGTGNWEYRTINPVSGTTTLLNTFSLADGITDDSFVTDPSSGLAYLMSGNSLYEFNLVTGAILGTSTLDTPILAYGLSSSGLVGLDFNSGTGDWEYRTINPASGTTTLLNSFTLANGLTDGSFLTDPSTGSAYLESVNELYDLNLATGAVLGTSTVDTPMAVIGISSVPEPSITLLMAIGILGIALVRIRTWNVSNNTVAVLEQKQTKETK